MALFFDSQWFDERLGSAGQSRDTLAVHMGLTRTDIDMIFKDQRELTHDEVGRLAAFIGAEIAEIVSRAGISTPNPAKAPASPGAELAALQTRVAQLEREVADLRSILFAKLHTDNS